MIRVKGSGVVLTHEGYRSISTVEESVTESIVQYEVIAVRRIQAEGEGIYLYGYDRSNSLYGLTSGHIGKGPGVFNVREEVTLYHDYHIFTYRNILHLL